MKRIVKGISFSPSDFLLTTTYIKRFEGVSNKIVFLPWKFLAIRGSGFILVWYTSTVRPPFVISSTVIISPPICIWYLKLSRSESFVNLYWFVNPSKTLISFVSGSSSITSTLIAHFSVSESFSESIDLTFITNVKSTVESSIWYWIYFDVSYVVSPKVTEGMQLTALMIRRTGVLFVGSFLATVYVLSFSPWDSKIIFA